MGQRRDRLNKRQARATVTRQENSLKKLKERNRRDEQMRAILKKGTFPYTPAVMSWASKQLGIKSSRITAKDVKALLK